MTPELIVLIILAIIVIVLFGLIVYLLTALSQTRESLDTTKKTIDSFYKEGTLQVDNIVANNSVYAPSVINSNGKWTMTNEGLIMDSSSKIKIGAIPSGNGVELIKDGIIVKSWSGCENKNKIANYGENTVFYGGSNENGSPYLAAYFDDKDGKRPVALKLTGEKC